MKLIRRIFLAFAVCLFVLSLVRFSSFREQHSRDTGASAPVSESEGWLIGSDGSRVYVQPLSGGHRLYIDGLHPGDLPEEDRRLLDEGFILPDYAALLALLEDYTG